MATRRPAARASTAVLECMAADDVRASRKQGKGGGQEAERQGGRNVGPAGPRLGQQPAVEGKIGEGGGHHSRSGQSRLRARTTTEFATPHSRIVLRSGHRATEPSSIPAIQAPSEIAPVARQNS